MPPKAPAIPPSLPNDLEIVRIDLHRLQPYERHARVHNRRQRRKLKSLIQHFGVVRPILIDENNVIVDGHEVVEVLKEMGAEDVPVVVVRNRTSAEIRALRLALNRVPEDAGWNSQKLQDEFRELIELGFDMELTGFDAVEIDMALDLEPAPSGSVEEVAAADLEPAVTTPISARGDIFRLGSHTVICGDSTSGDCLGEALHGLSASVVFTDPPYNLKIDGFVSGLGAKKHREFAMGAGEMTAEAFTTFLSRFIAALLSHLTDGAIIFICMDWRHMRQLADAAEGNGLELKNLCIWSKTNAGMGSFYRSQHELVFVYKHGKASHQNHFELGQHGRSRTNIWQYRGVNVFGKDRNEQLGIHPTCKPVAMIADAIRDVSRRGEIVLEPFLGSGSTLIAAEQTGRKCVGIELDPAYVDTVIRRWQKFTKQDAVLLSTGETFDDLSTRRTAENAGSAEANSGKATISDSAGTINADGTSSAVPVAQELPPPSAQCVHAAADREARDA